MTAGGRPRPRVSTVRDARSLLWRLGPSVVLVLLSSSFGTLASTARAEGASEPTSTAVQRLEGDGSALAQLARAVQRVPIRTASVVVVTEPRLTGDGVESLPTEGGARLWSSVQKNVAPLVPFAKRQVTEPLTPEQARLLARRGVGALTLIEPEIRGGSLLLRVSQRVWSPSFWRRAIAPQGTVTHSVTFSVSADAPIRALFPPKKQLLVAMTKAPSPVGSPVAIACGDAGEGREEIVVVGRRDVAIGALSEGKFSVRKRRPWTELSPVSATPLRAPLAASVIEDGAIVLSSSDRAELLELNADLEVVGRATRSFPLGRGSCVPYSETGLTAELESCPAPTQRPAQQGALSSGRAYDHVAREVLTEATGGVTEFFAQLSTGATTLEIHAIHPTAGRRTLEVERVGSAFALGDVNGDGTMDVVASSSNPDGDDALSVWSLEQEPQPLARHSLGDITAIALCPFAGTNPLAIVATSGTDLVLFR